MLSFLNLIAIYPQIFAN